MKVFNDKKLIIKVGFSNNHFSLSIKKHGYSN